MLKNQHLGSILLSSSFKVDATSLPITLLLRRLCVNIHSVSGGEIRGSLSFPCQVFAPILVILIYNAKAINSIRNVHVRFLSSKSISPDWSVSTASKWPEKHTATKEGISFSQSERSEAELHTFYVVHLFPRDFVLAAEAPKISHIGCK